MNNQEWVTVTEVERQGIWVESLQRSACDSCNARAGCGQRTLSNLVRTIRLWVPVDEPFVVGQKALLELPQGGLALSAFMLYGLPLLGLMVMAVLGQAISGELGAGLGALIGLALGLLASRLAATRFRFLWQPKIHSSCIVTDQTEAL